jgi:excisionase family DNA binding protein
MVTSEEAAEILGVPYRKLMRWVEKGLIKPYQAGTRKRAPRLWAPQHLREASLVRRLTEDRIPDYGIEAALDAEREGLRGKLLILGRNAAIVWDGKQRTEVWFAEDHFRVINLEAYR